MLKLSIRNVRKMAKMVASKGVKPHPFGGRFPTKIAIDVRWGRRPNQRWTYVGVPSIFAIHAMNKRMKLRNAAAKYWEFDRKAQLTYSHCQPGQNWLRLQNFNQTLIAMYHHWNRADDPHLGLTAPFWMKKVGGRWIYSPFEHLKMDTHIKPYKLWLAEALEKKPAEKKVSYNFRYEHVPLPEPEPIMLVGGWAQAARAEVMEAIQGPGIRDMAERQLQEELDLRARVRADHARRLRMINGFPE